MKSHTMAGKNWMAATAAILLIAGASTAHAVSINTKTEVKCFGALIKAVTKHQAAVAKAMADCRDRVIEGTPANISDCPDTSAQEDITKSADSVAKSVGAKCKSTCSVSGLECIDDIFCPPNGSGPENCTAGVKQKPFHSAAMGFPGAGCEAILADPMSKPADFSTCMAELAETNANEVVDLIYGSVDDTSSLSQESSNCLKAIAKTLPKAAGKIAGKVAKCRNTQLSLDPALMSPDVCATDDEKTAAYVESTHAKALDSISKACEGAPLAELDLCGEGPGGITLLADALECLGDVLTESSYSLENAEDRDHVIVSLVNAAYPDTTRPRCGDGIVNQIPSQFFRLGEECDGDDDAACDGQCLPPGDRFQCTCATTKRMHSYATSATADLDNGWSGASHNSKVTQGAGFVTTMENCDCDLFDTEDKASCVAGHSTDPVCDVYGAMGPRCNWGAYDGITCDAHGNANGVQTDTDCARCDENSINAGEYCVNEAGCDSQCFAPNGSVTGTCSKQSDCTAPDVCKGRCDNRTTYCNVLRNGAPLPLSSQGTSVCVDVRFFTDVTGTRNVLTGEHAVNFDQKSVTHLAQSASRPCPVCGGFCTAPGSKVGEICEGTCSGPSTVCRGGINEGIACDEDADCPASTCDGIGCRFDSDCTADPDATCLAASPECMGEDCQLGLLCAGGSRNGRTCRIESTTAFGTTSVECPPLVASNISGAGLHISYTPLTSEAVALENPGACDTPGFENLDGCYCVTGGGSTRTQPNRCAPACNAGANYGEACGGNFTTCVGGAEAGEVCDGPGDCSGGGACTGNPTICDAGANVGAACTSGADCPGGACTDACPGGLCMPLCVEKGACAGGTNDGGGCGVDAACPGGGTCVVTDAEEGVCAAGPPLYHCSGKGHEFRTCLPTSVGTTDGCEGGVDDLVGTEDDYVGAATCVADVRGCFVNGGAAEGGDTLNGEGDPTNTNSNTVFCIPASSSDSVNATAGLPGPARLRQRGLVVPNFTSLP